MNDIARSVRQYHKMISYERKFMEQCRDRYPVPNRTAPGQPAPTKEQVEECFSTEMPSIRFTVKRDQLMVSTAIACLMKEDAK